MRVLLLGGDGMLGRDLMATAPPTLTVRSAALNAAPSIVTVCVLAAAAGLAAPGAAPAVMETMTTPDATASNASERETRLRTAVTC